MKAFVMLTCLAAPLALAAATGASATPKMTPEQKMKAKQCSMEANAKKLHGDERFKYRAECMKK